MWWKVTLAGREKLGNAGHLSYIDKPRAISHRSMSSHSRRHQHIAGIQSFVFDNRQTSILGNVAELLRWNMWTCCSSTGQRRVITTEVTLSWRRTSKPCCVAETIRHRLFLTKATPKPRCPPNHSCSISRSSASAVLAWRRNNVPC